MVWALSLYMDDVRRWMGIAEKSDATVGGFIVIVLMSFSFGVVLNAVRYATLDVVNKWTNVPAYKIDFKKLRGNPKRTFWYEYNLQNYYRYYQFYGNLVFAILFAFIAWLWYVKKTPWDVRILTIFVVLIETILIWSARDTLQNFDYANRETVGTITQKKNSKKAHTNRR